MPVSFDYTLSSKIFDVPVYLRGLYGNVEPASGKIRGVSMGLFQISSPVCVLAGQDLEVWSEARVLHSRVIECRKCATGFYNLQIKLSFDACRRAEPRILADLPVRVQVPGEPTAMCARVMDLSHAGLGLQTPRAVPVGAPVAVNLGYATATGEVRHCAHQTESYRVGVQIRQFISLDGGLSPVFGALRTGSLSPVALQAFLRCLRERQLRYEAILASLAFRSKSALPAA